MEREGKPPLFYTVDILLVFRNFRLCAYRDLEHKLYEIKNTHIAIILFVLFLLLYMISRIKCVMILFVYLYDCTKKSY